MLKQRQSGFTIVELLIVIVVIGILAAVVIVAYNGVQTRAENAKTVSAMETYVKALRLYATDNGAYPITVASYYCVGGTSLTDPCGSVGGCTGSGVGPVGGSDQTFLDKFKTVISSLPEVSKQRVPCSVGTGNGALYYSGDGKTVSFIFFVNDTTCPSPAGLQLYAQGQSGSARSCWGTLPQP